MAAVAAAAARRCAVHAGERGDECADDSVADVDG